MAEDLRKRFTVKIDSIKVYNDKSLAAFSQGDVKTAILNIELTENDTALDLTGKKVRASFRKADGKNVMQDMTTGVSITDAIGGKVQVELSTQVLAAKGNVRGQLSITDEAAGLVAETVEFAFTVRESLLNSSIVSLDELPIVEKMIEAADVLGETDLQTIVSNTGNVNALKSEVETARGAYPTLEDKLNALVIEGGGTPSNVILFENWVSGEAVTIDTTTGPDVTAPVLTITPSATFSTTKTITMTTNETADIYYTIDGTTPTTASTKYTNALTISATTTVKAFAKNVAGNASAIQTITYTYDVSVPADTTAPNLTITPTATFTDTQTVTMSTNETATIWYTLDDTDPVTSVTKLQYTAPLTLTATDTIKVYAVDSANNASAVQTVTYTKQAAAWVTSGLVQKLDNKTAQTSITNDGTYFPASGDFTIAATMKPKAFLNILSQFNASSPATSTVRMFVDSTGQKLNVAVYGSTTANPAITGDSELTDTTLYYHVVLVRIGNVFSTYINNVLDKTYNYNSSTLNANNTEPVKIADASSDFKTAVYYSRALTTEELTQNYNALK
jgi:hypothetical protein